MMGEIEGLEGIMEAYATYKSLLAKLVIDLKAFNKTGEKHLASADSTALELASAAFLLGILPKNENNIEMPGDTLQCFYFVSATAAISGFSETPKHLHYLRMRFNLALDRHNRLTVKDGADQLKSEAYFHSYIALLKAAGLWDNVNFESKRHFEDCYLNTKTVGWIKNFKYKDHPLIEKVLGSGYSTQS